MFPSIGEYTSLFGLNKARLARTKPDALIMHPGPINRGVEIDSEIADCEPLGDPGAGDQRPGRAHGRAVPGQRRQRPAGSGAVGRIAGHCHSTGSKAARTLGSCLPPADRKPDIHCEAGRGAETNHCLGLLGQNDPQHWPDPSLKRVYFRCRLHAPTLPFSGASVRLDTFLGFG